MTENWQQATIASMGDLVDDPSLWTLDVDGDLQYPGDEEPGWTIWLWGTRIQLHLGRLNFECDVVGEGIRETAKRLLAAAEAWNEDPQP